jgi:predicted nuclease with TOPRIM domain
MSEQSAATHFVVPATTIEIVAYAVAGGDLCLCINAVDGDNLGRIVIEKLAVQNLARVKIGEHRLSPVRR